MTKNEKNEKSLEFFKSQIKLVKISNQDLRVICDKEQRFKSEYGEFKCK